MKKVVSKTKSKANIDMLPEYSFKDGIRGKHYKAYRKEHSVKINKTDGSTIVQYYTLDGSVVLEPEVQKYFPTSEAVNEALKSLIKLIPDKSQRDLKTSKMQ
jgi:hypothetical protein